MKKHPLLALAGYTVLTIFMTWPTLIHFATGIPGDGFDGWQNYWNQWWIKEALLVRQTHFFFTDILYPPSGASLLFHTLNFFNGLWTLPLQLNFGLAVAYNSVVFFHFILSGLGVFLLARYTLSRLLPHHNRSTWWASFMAGVIFTYSPFHMAHLLGHMQVFSLIWPPFYMLWVLRIVNQWRLQPEKPLRKTDLALAGLFLVFTTMIDWYQTLYMVLFTALILLWGWIATWLDKRPTSRVFLKPLFGLAAMGIAFGLLFAPLIAPMATEASQADYMRPSFEENVILSADLVAFFMPSELHPIWGEAVLPVYQTFTSTTSERLIFAGFVPLALAIFAVIRYRRERLVQFWAWFTFIFFVLALGPYLHVQGEIVQWGDTPLPLPYLGLYKIVPFIGISRSLSRFDLMVMIGLGVLAAIGVLRLKTPGQILATAIVCVEFLAIPFPISVVDTPDFFKTLGQDVEPYTIAALPMNWDRPSPLLYQTAHGKNLLTAYTSRQNPLDLSRKTPVFQQWRNLSDDIINVDLATVAPTIFHDFQLRYIVLDYYQMPPGPEREGTEKWVTAALPNISPIVDDGRLKVYEAPPMTNRVPYIQLGDGWGDLHITPETTTRMLDENAFLTIISDGAHDHVLILETVPLYSLRDLHVSGGGTDLPVTLSTNETEATIQIPSSVHQIQLQVPEPHPIKRIERQ
ncbi:MAG: hypothetical protein AAF629_09660 [Chloroflexota bacterium]